MHVGEVTLSGRRAVLATMHRKEEVIGPALAPLGLALSVCPGLDTDRFGTFSGEVPRAGTQLDAARAKIEAAFGQAPDASVGIASEGSFAPDPSLPIVPLDREIVLLVDRKSGLELTGHHATWHTNFGHVTTAETSAALEFARKHGFPVHGMIVMACHDNEPAPVQALFKNFVGERELVAAAEAVIQRFGKAMVQTDMRASWNPTRMEAIGRAASDLVRLYDSRCPACRYPGYDVIERIRGLPCAWCGEPTVVVREFVLSCRPCGHRETRPATGERTADPGRCTYCNP